MKPGAGRAWRRVVLITLDGVGIGALPDAGRYGDAGANTLLHVAEACGGLRLPTLQSLGLGNLLPLPGVAPVAAPAAGFGRMRERSAGKDTTTGHWELAGVLQAEPFPTFPDGFPPEIIAAFRRETGLDSLGNVAAIGTEIIRRLGEEHLCSGRPIVYTSADSVFQVAAHEAIIPVERLYEICRIARRLLDPYRVGRVIARPFVAREKEEPLPLDRPAQSRPPLVEDEFPLVPIGRVEEVARAQVLVVVVLEKGAVKLVGAALELNIDCGAAGEPLLGVKAAGHDVDGLNRFERRNVGRDVREPGIGGGRAVDARVVDLIARAVYVERKRTRRVGLNRVNLRGGSKAGKGLVELLVVATQRHGQVLELFLGDLGPHLRAVGLKQRRHALDGDGLGDRAHLERHIDPRDVVERDRHVGLDELLEAGERNLERVASAPHRGKTEAPGVARHGGAGPVGFFMRDDHFRAGDGRSGRIRHVADDRAIENLRLEARRHGKARDGTHQTGEDPRVRSSLWIHGCLPSCLKA